MLRRLRRLLAGVDAATEADSERDGVLSYAVEFHALAIGAALGFAAVSAGDYQLAATAIAIALGANRARERLTKTVRFQIRTEPWYFFGGLALGASPSVLAGGAVPI